MSKIKQDDKANKIKYMLEYLILGSVTAFNLYKILPELVPIASLHQSVFKLLLCILGTCLFGFVLSHNQRDDLLMVCDILAGAGMYILITLGDYETIIVKIVAVLLLVITAINIYTSWTCKKIGSKNKRRRILKRCKTSLLLVRRNTSLACAVLLFAIPGMIHFKSQKEIVDSYYDKIAEARSDQNNQTEVFKDDYEVETAYDDTYSLENNIDVIKDIRTNEEFQALSYEEKCKLVIALTNAEAYKLGLCEINIEFKDLEESTLGQYDYETKTIIYNSKQLKDGSIDGGSNEEVLSTVLHSCRHCYQYMLCELYASATPEQRSMYIFRINDVADWIDNFNSYYKIADTDFSATEYLDYIDQPLESDAKGWAASESVEFFYSIDKYIE